MRLPAFLAGSIVCALAASAPATAGEIPEALVVLETRVETVPGDAPEAAPPRFVLLEDGQVFVGGSSGVAAGRVSSREVKAIEKRLAAVRRLPGLGGSVVLGPGAVRHHLSIRKGRPLDLVAEGDLSKAPASLHALASLLADLEAFDHPSLRAFAPKEYLLTARHGALTGGCRPWHLRDALVEGKRVVPADNFPGWPAGARPASVCVEGSNWIVALRPLLPGERP